MKVIGAGFGRTGTMSLKAALEELGCGPCYHMVETTVTPEHVEAWSRVSLGESIDWKQLFRDYNSAVDWPASAFYKQLMDVFPNAKVILTVRDPNRWYESALNTIYQPSVKRRANKAIETPDEHVSPEERQRRAHGQMVDRLLWEGVFHGRFEDRDFAIGLFLRNIDNVKRQVPAHRLLVYEIKEGWAPLCRFLGVDVPVDRPFPYLNDTASFQQQNPVERQMAEQTQSNRE
jgi:hypothetical protein